MRIVMNLFNKLALGTVQWGMSYGIANKCGQPVAAEINDLLQYASNVGITLLDTAYAYGEAELVIGKQRQLTEDFKIVTKTKPIQSADISEQDCFFIEEGFHESLQRLQSTQTYGLLAHNADDLLAKGGDHLWTALQNIKYQGYVKKIGVSVYHPEQLNDILDRYEIDLVQLPFNIYDQRFAKSGVLSRLKQSGVEVHARSAFLQGLLLLSAEKLPEQFNRIHKHHTLLYKKFHEVGVTAVEGCLSFCLEHSSIDKVLVGCESMEQLKGIVDAANKANDCLSGFDEYSIDEESIINPSMW